MKRLLLTIACILFCAFSYCQGDLSFGYDSAGNQIFRGNISTSSMSQTTDSTVVVVFNTKKEAIADPVSLAPDQNLIEISAAPNPVVDILQVTWKNTEDNYFLGMALYSYHNQLLVHSSLDRFQQSHSLSFGRYPHGTYILVFTTSKGAKQTYKIIKQ